MSPLRICSGKVELFVSRPTPSGPWLVSWPSKHWSCFVPVGADPTPFWLRDQRLGANQAETVSEMWRQVVRPTLERIETLAGVIASELRTAWLCPPTRIEQVEQLVRLTQCEERALLVEALRALERAGRVKFSTTSDNEIVWYVTDGSDS